MAVNSYRHRTNDLLTESSKTNYERTTGQLTIWPTVNDCLTKTIDGSKRTNHITNLHSQWHHGLTDRRPIKSRLNWPIRSLTRVWYHQLTWYNSLWLWRWLPHRLSKRQSLSTTTVLFRTTFTQTIILNLLIILHFIFSFSKPIVIRTVLSKTLSTLQFSQDLWSLIHAGGTGISPWELIIMVVLPVSYELRYGCILKVVFIFMLFSSACNLPGAGLSPYVCVFASTSRFRCSSEPNQWVFH